MFIHMKLLDITRIHARDSKHTETIDCAYIVPGVEYPLANRLYLVLVPLRYSHRSHGER